MAVVRVPRKPHEHSKATCNRYGTWKGLGLEGRVGGRTAGAGPALPSSQYPSRKAMLAGTNNSGSREWGVVARGSAIDGPADASLHQCADC